LDPNIHGTLKPRRGQTLIRSAGTVQRRLTEIRDRYSLDTQHIRLELILQLKALAEMANQKAIDTHPAKTEEKQNWARLAAYISQVINSIGKTYDEAKVDADLAELEELVKKMNEKRNWEPRQ
jgi:hypothetical protein